MATLGWYLAHWLFYYFMFGLTLHVLDRFMGVPFYRWWYNRSREIPMPHAVDMGLMYNRSFGRRHNLALVISAIQSIHAVVTGSAVDPFVEIIVLVFEAEVLLLGFWAGKWIYQIIKRQKDISETVDRVGTQIEQTDFAEIFRRFVKVPLTGLQGIFIRSKPKKPLPQPVVPSELPTQEPISPDWRDRLKRYTGREE